MVIAGERLDTLDEDGRAALDLLLAQGPLSRTTLGNLTGLSKPTASQLLARLDIDQPVAKPAEAPAPVEAPAPTDPARP